MAPQQAVNTPQQDHSDSVGQRVGKETFDFCSPVIKKIACQFLAQPVSKETTHYRKPNNEEIQQVVQHIQEFITGIETETKRSLREKKEAEVLKVSIEEERSQVYHHAERSQEF